MTSAQPEGRFGALDIQNGGQVSKFVEKPKADGTWINGGFFVLNRKIFDYFEGKDMTTIMWEEDPMHQLVADNQLVSYKHNGFWKCMDILRDNVELEKMWESGRPAWKIW